MALYIDARTNLLTKYETIGGRRAARRRSSRDVFADYRDVEGLKAPFRTGVKYDGEIVYDQTNSDIKVNTRPDDQLFAMHKGVTNGPRS